MAESGATKRGQHVLLLLAKAPIRSNPLVRSAYSKLGLLSSEKLRKVNKLFLTMSNTLSPDGAHKR